MTRRTWALARRWAQTDMRDDSGNPLSWPACRERILERDSWACYLCGAPADEVDHVLPRRYGGLDTWANLKACCGACNRKKGDRIRIGRLALDDLLTVMRSHRDRAMKEIRELSTLAYSVQDVAGPDDDLGEQSLTIAVMGTDLRSSVEWLLDVACKQIAQFEETPHDAPDVLDLRDFTSQPHVRDRIADLVRCGVAEVDA